MLKSINNIFFLILFICSSSLFSQGINFSVKDDKGVYVKNVKVFFYESGSENYKEFLLIRNGSADYTLGKNYQNLFIKVVSEGYFAEEKLISDFNVSQTYRFNFQLKKDEVYAIEEVKISKRKEVVIKKDTVTYNIERFKDGTEVKLEDILKKLPGIEVDDSSGVIKYKGKSIETITLDGDNLFDSNYTIGSKNINFDMIDQVEAIDNYQTNPLLIDVKRGDKVSLNVKLKKNILNISGSAGYESGFFGDKKQLYDFSGNIVTLFNNLKSFSTVEFNNVGQSGISDFSAKDSEYKYNKTIDEIYTTASLPTTRFNFNDHILGSLNLIYKPNSSSSFKVNYNLSNDEILMRENSRNSYLSEDISFVNNSSTDISKSVLKNYANGEFNYLPSKKLRINSIFTVDNTKDFQNGLFRFNTQENLRDLSFNQTFLKSVTNVTTVFQNDDVLDVFLKVNSFDGNDSQTFSPNLQLGNLYSLQNVKSEKNTLTGYFNFYKKFRKIKLIQSMGFKSYDINLDSDLQENTVFNNEKNNVSYKDRSFFTNTSLKYNYRKWSFETKFNLEDKIFKFQNEAENWSNNQFLIGNESIVNYVFNAMDFISANLEYIKKPIVENYLYQNYIRTSFNSVQKNLITNGLQTTKSAGIKFWHNDIEKQFLINTYLNYSNESGHYFSNLNLDNALISTIYFYSPRENNQFTHIFNLSKLIYPLKIKVKFNTLYSHSNYFNIINNDQRKVNLKNFNFTIGLTSAFSSKIRFENEMTLGFLNFKSDVETRNTSIRNKFTFVLIPLKSFSLINEFYTYVPNKTEKSTFNFLDITARYLPIKTKYSFSLSIRNLLNERSFVNTFTTDFSQMVQSIPLLSFHFSVGGSYRF